MNEHNMVEHHLVNMKRFLPFGRVQMDFYYALNEMKCQDFPLKIFQYGKLSPIHFEQSSNISPILSFVYT